MDDLIGAWVLKEFSAGREGGITRPLGERPGGVLLYTAGGWMSALLTADPALPGGAAGVPGEPGGTVAYAGRWERTANGAVLHHVEASHHSPWAGVTLERAVRLRGDDLELSALTAKGSRLLMRWCRASDR
ncbi:lipocalin-like domain-containing protein [Streptomyces sp. NPDC049837]|uniref:lipocalin-like domain-containing protein n=1 Tax=Streptomyces sp. NPDC049837 TaxID=3155277 RepID=UPI0034402CEC